MATVGLMLSTGRTSTQTIAKIAARACPEAIVEHEGLGPDYFSRTLFRRPERFIPFLGGNVALQRKFISIEDAVAGGTSYLEVGWPAYAWLPYFADRFGRAFRFAHLVRNPFEVAASLTTHGLFSETARRPPRHQRKAMIHVSDRNVHYADIAAGGSGFGPFERNLFHWLELNRFFVEQHDRAGFLGVFRFEDLYRRDDPAIRRLLEGFLGVADLDLDLPPVDGYQKPLGVEITEPDAALVGAAIELGLELGYRKEDLLGALDTNWLNERYSRRRL